MIRLLVLLAACSAPPAPTPADQLSWMVGSWSHTDNEIRTEETWLRAPDGDLLGTGHARGGRVLLFSEHLTILRDGDHLAYVAWPIDQQPVVFPLVHSGPAEVVFENTSHDFPQRIAYTRTDANTLAVQAKGTGEAGPRVESWTLTRVPPTP